ncbi:poly [ADP-ribose] polymerase 11 isoform X3 [Sigmodon hispidus]
MTQKKMFHKTEEFFPKKMESDVDDMDTSDTQWGWFYLAECGKKKAQLKKKRGVPQINEQMLFHGTSSEFVEAICIHNFDWRINGVPGAVFGKGTYFARDAAYSSRFCKDDIKHGNTFQILRVSVQQRHLFRTYKSMFLARVLIGDYINGDSKYMRPPSKDGTT